MKEMGGKKAKMYTFLSIGDNITQTLRPQGPKRYSVFSKELLIKMKLSLH